MTSRPNVVVLIETSNIYGRRLLRGVTKYLHTTEPWSLLLDERELDSAAPSWVRTWKGDGVLCRPMTLALADILQRNGVAAVDMSDSGIVTPLPRVVSDHYAIGRVGAEHLLERGFRDLAFCGFKPGHWSSQRYLGFEAAVLRAQGTVHRTYTSAWHGLRRHPWEAERNALARWMADLPRPIGIMACNDVRAQHVLDAARHLRIAVPEEIAVVGVDNDELLCEISDPPLSSVVPDPERIGYEAACLLDKLMIGRQSRRREPSKAADTIDIQLAPLGVVTRQSTDITAIPDADVAAAIQIVRRRACSGLTVDDLLRELALSRATLERRFRKYLNRSPQAEIRRIQLDRAKFLLVQTELPLSQIARLVGFEHSEYFSVVFKRVVGCTPGQFRADSHFVRRTDR